MERTVLATLTGRTREDRLQVSLVRRADGRFVIDLREQHHAEGVGWFDQRAMSLDPRQLRELQAVLKLEDAQSFLDAAEAESPWILPFPAIHDHEDPRRAAGAGR